jgi:hypothetical protein
MGRMGSRVRRPEIDVLPLTQGDTITVKRYLTAAEFRDVVKASTRPVKLDGATPGADIALEIDPTESGLATVLAYLLDWTFTDYDGRPLTIREQPPATVRAALDAIDAESYLEVQRAIQSHDKAMRALIAQEKKLMSGSPTPETISQSPA